MFNPERFGGVEAEKEHSDLESEKESNLILKEVIIELLGKINQSPEMKERMETYANRE